MRIFSKARWLAYKEVVAESLDKALELFATKKVDSSLPLDLNRRASPLDSRSPPPVEQELWIEPPLSQTLSPISRHQDEVLEEDNDDCEGEDDDDVELHDDNVGDLEKYITQHDMDRDLPYSRGYASDSDDDGPEEEVDEEGFTAREAEIHHTVLGRDHRVPLFRDLSLTDEATVDGGKGIMLGPRTSSYRDGNEVNNGFCKGSRFKTLLEFKQWIKDFSVKHHRPYTVVHSDIKKRYTVKCEAEGCPWIVRARPFKGGMGTRPNKGNDGDGVNYSAIWANAMKVVEERKRKEKEEEKKRKEEEEEKKRKAFEEESQDYLSDSWGKKFFMCANYNRSPERSRNPYDKPRSPPPVCRYYTWIDLEQPQSNKAIQEIDFAIRRSRYEERLRDEDMARKRKERNDEIRRKEEEEERKAKEARAAERERLRQAAWRSMEEEEEKKRKGKGPML
uniref:Uncharacterized protein n=1 Tax=Avena sativa TaxID=4498 RepID=A0ACD5YFM3_AVESA